MTIYNEALLHQTPDAYRNVAMQKYCDTGMSSCVMSPQGISVL